VTEATPAVVDVIVPVHDATRPVEVAVRSATSEIQGVASRVIVVLHNYRPDEDRRRALAEMATVISLDDGIPSASGPRNAGIRAATAPYVFPLDSDDRLAPGCLRLLYDVALETNADVVLPSIRMGDRYLGTPPVWSRRRTLLDVVDDGLFTRSHCPALLRRENLDHLGATYPTGIRVSEDLVFMSQLYSSSRVALAFDAVYLVDEGGPTRASATGITSDEQMAFLEPLLGAPWAETLPSAVRRSLARRLLATNLAGGWRRRSRAGQDPDRDAYVGAVHRVLAYSPDARRLLSVRDRFSLSFPKLSSRRAKVLTSRPFGLIPSSLQAALSSQGPLRLEARTHMARVRRRSVSPNSDGDQGPPR
jgi:Glycosyl transferase family 2